MLIVGLITPHCTYLTITETHNGRPRPGPGCSATDDDDVKSDKITSVLSTRNTSGCYTTKCS
jgi:hypothetical protein